MIHFLALNLISNPPKVNPVRKFQREALNPRGIILKFTPATEQQCIISNGVNPLMKGWAFALPLICPKKRPAISGRLFVLAFATASFNLGNVLLSHTVAHAAPSALKGLTSVFGMGTGVSPSPWSPRNLKSKIRNPSIEILNNVKFPKPKCSKQKKSFEFRVSCFGFHYFEYG